MMAMTTNKHWTSEYLRMAHDCEQRESQLTDWERDFIESVGYRLGNELALSQKQLETLENIWERVTKNG